MMDIERKPLCVLNEIQIRGPACFMNMENLCKNAIKAVVITNCQWEQF